MISTSLATLLLVEDEHRLRNLVSQFLKSEGFEIQEAADGGEALDVYKANRSFDLVLLDLNLPVCSGVEVCRGIKAIDPDQRVIVCSAAIVQEHETELMNLGVSRFLSKPYHPEELVAQILMELKSVPRRKFDPTTAVLGR